jgi:hypothetical protein
MPTRADQLPGGPTALARRIAALEREVRELRAARRLPHSALSTGAVSLLGPEGEVLAEVTPAFGGGPHPALAAYDTQAGQRVHGALTAAALRFGTPSMTEAEEAFLAFSALGDGLFELLLSSARTPGTAAAQINLYNETDPAADNARIDLNAGLVNVLGILTARSLAFGQVTITPSAANTPTSATVNGLNLAGTTFRAFTSPSSVAPGTTTGNTGVTGTSATSVTATGLTVWVNRQSTTTTNVNWMVTGQ